MKNILILGSKSELGKKIINTSELKNYKIITDSFIKKKNKNSYDNFLLKKIAETDIVLNLVGYSGASRIKLKESNYRFTDKLVDLINSMNKKKILLIHLSTLGVLDLKNINSEKYKPNNYYEYTKISSEKAILNKKNKFNFLIIRSAALYDLKNSNFSQNLLKAVILKKYLLIFNKESKVYYTKTKDLADMITQSIKNSKKNKILNFSNTETVELYFKKFYSKKIKILVANKIITHFFIFFSNINRFLNFYLDNKLLKYFWLFNSVKNIKKSK